MKCRAGPTVGAAGRDSDRRHSRQAAADMGGRRAGLPLAMGFTRGGLAAARRRHNLPRGRRMDPSGQHGQVAGEET